MTYIIIIITVLFSVSAFINRSLFSRMQFNPYSIRHHNEWYRFFTYGFLHADWIHLIINMFVLLSFGQAVEQYFSFYFGTKAYLYYVLLYAGGIVFSVLYDYGKHKDDIYYNAVGASGAVSAVVFSNILFNPTSKLYIFLIPIGIPAIIFGVLYLVYSAYMSKRGSDNIGHNAHFYGALFGIFFTIILKPKLLLVFYQQIAALFGN